MAKKTEQYEKEILAVIKKHPDICFIREIFCEYAGCCRDTFYDHGLDKSDRIKNALEENRIAIVREMRGNWKKKDAAPALQMGAMKLMGTEDVLRRLSTQHTELSTSDGQPLVTLNGITWPPNKLSLNSTRKAMANP